ncbi:AbgT family transporter [Spiractinospora alimapuensis]|nr:AbgT family transporter [Spiractinospora alimapuensis]QVQ54914.1 AbgT family transporter [Spiractinospora alimapuensis]
MRLLLGTLQGIERVGNKLPHPFWLFTILAGFVVLLSAVLEWAGAFAVSPEDGERIEVQSLVSREGVHMMLTDAVENFATFPPFALIITVMLGVAVAERGGLLNAMLRGSVVRVPPKYLTFMLAFTGVSASVASDAAYVVLLPLGALAFQAVGRSPILGLIVAFGSVSAGYDASIFVTATDVIFAGLSSDAARLITDGYTVSPLANYFFNVVSAIVLALMITLVTEFVLTRRTQNMVADGEGVDNTLGEMQLRPEERRGLLVTGIVFLVFVGVVVALLVPSNSWFRGEDGGVISSPIITGIAPVLGLLFLVTGYAYGRTVGTFTRAREVPAAMASGVRELAPVIVLFFAAAQFLAYFGWSNMGTVLAIRGADVLGSAGVPSLVLLLAFVLLATVMNMFITSGSAQWALIAPVFVPMFMLLNISPETTQAAYRIADSSTNLISPMSPYFVMALGFLQRYRKDAGIGTLISLTLPISITVLLSWSAVFVLWWLFGLPLGPGVPIR